MFATRHKPHRCTREHLQGLQTFVCPVTRCASVSTGRCNRDGLWLSMLCRSSGPGLGTCGEVKLGVKPCLPQLLKTCSAWTYICLLAVKACQVVIICHQIFKHKKTCTRGRKAWPSICSPEHRVHKPSFDSQVTWGPKGKSRSGRWVILGGTRCTVGLLWSHSRGCRAS
jgi:hypothetical protein